MHDSKVVQASRPAELLEHVGALAEPEQREAAAEALARVLGGERLMFFAADPELGVLLPAPGTSQVLRDASGWRRFLDRCPRDGSHEGSAPGPDGRPLHARACMGADGTAAVLFGAPAGGGGPEPLRPLLPLLGALFCAERTMAADAVRVRASHDAVERSNVLTRSLQQMRERLERALREADEANSVARERADQAEALAAELESQAAQLQEHTVELELLNDELAIRTDEAEDARAAADSANRAKSEFLASMSHELRTPINAVIGYAELLNMGITGPVTEKQQVQLERIRVSSSHLLGLINEILDLAKVESGRMTVKLEREEARTAILEAITLIETQADKREITLVDECRDVSHVYFGDADRVRQILVNLLSNAVKFTDPGGTVTVTCGPIHEATADAVLTGPGPWTCLAVTDTGIGLDDDEITRVFQPFVQADTGTTRTQGGTGLGLTISRQLARLMGGDLTVESEKGEGSTFTLWLPSVAPQKGELDASIKVGETDGQPLPPGVAQAGEHLQAGLSEILDAISQRFRTDSRMAAAPETVDAEMLDQLPVLIADLASTFIRLGTSGDHQGLLWNGSRIQRLIAEEHGADRGRRGWDAETLRREFAILREELKRVVRAAAAEDSAMDAEGVISLLDHLVQKAEFASIRSLRAVAVAAE